MESINRLDLNIDGVSTASGGDYGKVKIDGVGTVEGDVIAEIFDSNGITKVRGNLRTGEMDSDGIIKIYGHLSAGYSVVDGNLKVIGSVKAERFKVNGVLNVGEDCEIEDLDMEGAFDVQGLLNVGKMNVRLHGKGKVKEIGGENIQVRRVRRSVWGKMVTWMLPKFSPELHTASIEGDDIDLEYTLADVVRGNRVVIGKGCNIGTVEYRTELKVYPGAKIGKEVKTGG
ncbi:cell shape determination protein CcmA [Cohnella herbarum]|uniref:Cell shape determination protein CcmA n=1 Tax=Cohnella herbarum TaxID=2728023 RepID=A0A7Z2ZMN1_9BACL|nr:cell shape determination protein CcmA [Cohnella herbarum]QJD84262.1 cell shape determination protein CcmA [Cohnella herbarum]